MVFINKGSIKRKKECLKCKKAFYCPYGVGIGRWLKRKYCSKSCSSSVTVKGRKPWNLGKKMFNMRGENNSKWKGGITKKDRLERNKFRRFMQREIFERDKYKCTFCGKGGNLQVDHIQPWAEYVEGRFDINNCRTLCIDCHYEITFGRKITSKAMQWGRNFGRRVFS